MGLNSDRQAAAVTWRDGHLNFIAEWVSPFWFRIERDCQPARTPALLAHLGTSREEGGGGHSGQLPEPFRNSATLTRHLSHAYRTVNSLVPMYRTCHLY